MQSLFALQQCKDANYELCLEKITEMLSPDLNSMKVQDKVELSVQKKEALKLFKEAFAGDQKSIEHTDIKIKKAVNDCLIFYHNQNKKDAVYFGKNLVSDVEKIYERYIDVLSLAIEFLQLAESDKKVSHKNFVSNSWIKGLRDSPDLKKEIQRTGKNWSGKMDRVRVWFRDVIRQDAEYLHYLDKKSPSMDDQKRFANHIFKKIILGKTVINEYFEEEVQRWAEDKEIVKGLVEKTVKSFDPEAKVPLTLHTLSVNWDDDKEFIEKLFKRGSELEPKYRDLIASNTRNWEVDRLPLTDRIILEMAIAEMIIFPNIPVKVSINEYIELAKNYSTPKSRQFINGILDVIAKELKNAGDLKKSGRGLIDNK
jgi:N utilization substance protein B